ncbi:hypothetical protein EDB19DRAFT_1912601 [Suillus lakei]|nr:hypothetical protein EDB19DRAFT_1912601 [Suillus lakei]
MRVIRVVLLDMSCPHSLPYIIILMDSLQWHMHTFASSGYDISDNDSDWDLDTSSNSYQAGEGDKENVPASALCTRKHPTLELAASLPSKRPRITIQPLQIALTSVA